MRMSDWSSDVCSSDLVADADPGNGQRGQPDQRQELAHAFEKAACPRRGAVTILDFEPRRRKGAFQRLARCADLRARCDPNAVFAFIKTAGLDQRGTTDTFDRRDRHWPQREALSHPVGLVSDDVTDAKVRIAIAQ